MLVYRLLGVVWRQLPVRFRRRLVRIAVPAYTVGVCGVVVDDDGRVLLLRHRFREKQSWELPGGFLPRAEEPEEALRRELEEETGLQIEVGPLATVRVRMDAHIDICYAARVRGDTTTRANLEILEARFFPEHELPPLDPDQKYNVLTALSVAARDHSGP